jgi:hypothetical protein
VRAARRAGGTKDGQIWRQGFSTEPVSAQNGI